MCDHCFREYVFGEHAAACATEITHPSERAIALAKRVKARDDEGTYDPEWHVVFEDWNIEDRHLDPASARDPVARAIIADMRSMSLAERAAAFAIAEGWLAEDGRVLIEP